MDASDVWWQLLQPRVATRYSSSSHGMGRRSGGVKSITSSRLDLVLLYYVSLFFFLSIKVEKTFSLDRVSKTIDVTFACNLLTFSLVLKNEAGRIKLKHDTYKPVLHILPVTKIEMPALAATSMVPETVVPPFSF